MEYGTFIRQVQERAGLGSEEEADRVTEAVLETLGEHLYLHRTVRRHFASELPKPLQNYVLKRETGEHIVSLEEFNNRVSARADIGYPSAVKGTEAVIATLREAVSEGELRHMMDELPHEWHELFGIEPL